MSGGVLVTVRLPAALRECAGGAARVSVGLDDGATVRGLLDRLAVDLPALERRLRTERGELRRHVNVYLGQDDVRAAGLLDVPLRDGAELLVIPSVAGG